MRMSTDSWRAGSSLHSAGHKAPWQGIRDSEQCCTDTAKISRHGRLNTSSSDEIFYEPLPSHGWCGNGQIVLPWLHLDTVEALHNDETDR